MRLFPVCVHVTGNGTLKTNTLSRVETNFGQLYIGNVQKYFGNCPTLPYLDLFFSTMYKGILKV